MATFLRLTLALFTLCAAYAGVSHWLVSRQSVPVAAVFNNPDGTACESPCLFGVQPGITPFDRAVALIRAHPFTRQFEPNLAGDIFRHGSERVIIAWGLGNDRVSSIELVTGQGLEGESLGEVIAVLGPPDRVVVDGVATRSFWRAGQLEFIHILRQAGFVNPADPLESIVIQQAQPNEWLAQAVSWQGFSTVAHYRTAKR